MPRIKVAAAVLNQTPMAWESNTKNIIDAIEAARREQVSLLCLPELCITGYGCEDYFFAYDLEEQAKKCLLEIVGHTEDMIVGLGLPLRHNNRLYDVACLVANKRILGFYCKQNLANNGIHYESRWFHPWPAGIVEKPESTTSTTPSATSFSMFRASGLPSRFVRTPGWRTGRGGGTTSAAWTSCSTPARATSVFSNS